MALALDQGLLKKKCQQIIVVIVLVMDAHSSLIVVILDILCIVAIFSATVFTEGIAYGVALIPISDLP